MGGFAFGADDTEPRDQPTPSGAVKPHLEYVYPAAAQRVDASAISGDEFAVSSRMAVKEEFSNVVSWYKRNWDEN